MNTINAEEVVILLNEFVKKSHSGFKKETVKNLFVKKAKDGRYYDRCSFARYIYDYCYEEVNDQNYAEAVRQTVKSYSSSKDSAIELIKRFTLFLKKKTGLEFKVDYPPIPVNNTFERLMYISKYFQNPDAKISDLEDTLWVSSRTIEEDLRKLRGRDEDPIQICGRKYVIKDVVREDDHIRDMASTVHPFFLTCNLTQVIVMLKGLKEMSEQPFLKEYAMKTAGEIWEQMSDMAKNRISYVMKELMPDDSEWFASLGKMGDNTFWPEHTCSTHGSDCVIECFKNDFPCCIEYQNDSGIEIIREVRILNVTRDEVRILTGEKERSIRTEQILRSAKTPEELF